MLTLEIVRQSVLAKGYKWFTDRPNIIGIRTKLNIPNVFNDQLVIVGADKSDIYKVYPITTDPGLFYLNKPLNDKGCAVVVPGQYINVWQIGFHHGKSDHRALVQTGGKIKVWRDNNRNNIAEETSVIEEGYFGINCHGVRKGEIAQTIGPHSAGCQVHPSWTNKEQMMDIMDLYKSITKNYFTYTLLKEEDLQL